MRGMIRPLVLAIVAATVLPFLWTQSTRRSGSKPHSPRVLCDTGTGDGVLPPQSEDDPSQLRVAFISGEAGLPHQVIYSVRNGLAIFQGDIVLGSVDEIDRKNHIRNQFGPQSVAVSGQGLLWPDNTVKYKIDPQLPNQGRIDAAINVWQQGTNIKFLPAGTDDSDFIYFTAGTGCSSPVGRRGGQQNITLADGCAIPQTIHEIGHSLGLLHEHDRSDRDIYINLNTANIPASWQSQFQKVDDSTSTSLGPYDFCSIMHYPQVASGYQNNNQPVFDYANQCPVCVAGKVDKPSQQDFNAVNTLYPSVQASKK